MSVPVVVCGKCAGLGYIPCGIHGDAFTEVYPSTGLHICGKCADEGKGEASDLEVCPKCSAKLTKGQRICFERGYHEDEEFIDPRSGGFTRCKTCKRDVDREESEEW